MALFPKSPPPDQESVPAPALPPSAETLSPEHSVVTNTASDPLASHSDRHPSVASTWAKEQGYFATDLIEEVKLLTIKGIQPLHVEGPKTDRPHNLYVYELTPEKAKELLHG